MSKALFYFLRIIPSRLFREEVPPGPGAAIKSGFLVLKLGLGAADRAADVWGVHLFSWDLIMAGISLWPGPEISALQPDSFTDLRNLTILRRKPDRLSILHNEAIPGFPANMAAVSRPRDYLSRAAASLFIEIILEFLVAFRPVHSPIRSPDQTGFMGMGRETMKPDLSFGSEFGDESAIQH